MDLTTRVSLVQNLLTTKEIPASVGAKLLDINRTSIYYKGTPTSDEELACKEIIDHLHTDNPSWGARQMSAQLKARGYHVGRRKTRRYMNEMDIYPIYPKMNLSKRMQQAKVCPYLLRNAIIDKPNQAWSIDITYIPIKRGFLYLTAVIDWHSRCIVGWEVDDTLDTRMVINALKKAFKVAKPQILNSDQGCQFTSQQYIDFVKVNGIRQSMDGKSRWADNIMIERWFRSFKYEEAYLTGMGSFSLQSLLFLIALIQNLNYCLQPNLHPHHLTLRHRQLPHPQASVSPVSSLLLQFHSVLAQLPYSLPYLLSFLRPGFRLNPRILLGSCTCCCRDSFFCNNCRPTPECQVSC